MNDKKSETNSVNNAQLVRDFEFLKTQLLSVHNKLQEGIQMSRNGKIYYADTKFQGVKQKILNLYYYTDKKIESFNNENN